MSARDYIKDVPGIGGTEESVSPLTQPEQDDVRGTLGVDAPPEPDHTKDLSVESVKLHGDTGASTELGECEVEVICSTVNEDRDGDTIDQHGIDVTHYRENPIQFWMHGHGEVGRIPIGVARNVRVEDGKLHAILRYPFKTDDYREGTRAWEHADFCEFVLAMFKSGMLNCVSIGFMAKPEHVEEREGGGFHFSRIELTEISPVPIPSNRQAVAVRRELSDRHRKRFDAVTRFAKRWVERAQKQDDLPAPPDSFRENLRIGLEWHEQGFSGDGLEETTVRWAGRMAQGEAPSEERADTMHAWWARNISMDGPLRDDDDNPTPKAVAWKLWGGKEAGPAYARRLMRAMGRGDEISDALKSEDTDDDKGTPMQDGQKAGQVLNEENRMLNTLIIAAAARQRENNGDDPMAVMDALDTDRMMEVLDEFDGLFQDGMYSEEDGDMPDEEMREAVDLIIKGVTPDVAAEIEGLLDAKAQRLEMIRSNFSETEDGELPRQNVHMIVKALKRDIRGCGRLLDIMHDSYDLNELSEEMRAVKRLSTAIAKANEGALTADKMATEFQDLPLAARDREWSSDAAINRWREFSDSTESPSEQYRENFMWFDDEEPGEFGSYKLPYGDIIDGEHVAVPRGLFAVAAALQGARGGVDLPEGDIDDVREHVEQYYEKMRDEFDDDAIVAPWQTEDALRDWAQKMARALDCGVSPTTKSSEDLHATPDNYLLACRALGKTPGALRVKGQALAAVLNAEIESQVEEGRPRADIVGELAQQAGRERSAVNDILAARTNCPPGDVLDAFAEVLGVDAGQFRTAAEEDGCAFGEDRGADGRYKTQESAGDGESGVVFTLTG